MQAVIAIDHGGPEVLTAVPAHPEPRPGNGRVLVEVAASGVNFIDISQRRGVFAVPTPFVPGVEAAGTVVELGPGVTGVAVGDPVAWVMDGSVTTAHGAYAQRAVVSADRLVPIPDGLDAESAASILMHGLTAHYLTHDAYRVRPGDTVVVHAAAGGLGGLLTQYAVARGARVIATVSDPAKHDRARAAGADLVLGYEGFAERVREATDGRGADAVYDGVGAATFDGGLASLRTRGTMVLLGGASGPVRDFDTGRLLGAGSLYLTRPGIADYIRDRTELLGRAHDVFERMLSGALRVHVGGRYPLAQARRAHEDLESRRSTGKLLLIP
ncbi:quinone oxidoreductase family protein [Embleya scabrispora]|uniref:quinone oxidoreductase family protein n=1 Tax=Embleya scabrispora TaxID=159449 RepID=UPI000373C38E|nr:quinone oxidoreductase [Embleya scabrispora]MYS82677.1 zinc-binding dehydrogenase [Streptomyces sp. SID5474]